jgi:hypothetical protein
LNGCCTNQKRLQDFPAVLACHTYSAGITVRAASASRKLDGRNCKTGLEIDTLHADIRFSHAAGGCLARFTASRFAPDIAEAELAYR